jgi:ornithine decarboxylase
MASPRGARQPNLYPQKHIRREVPQTAVEYLREQQPVLPVNFLDHAALTRNAAEFVALFPGAVAYAAKCNPAPDVLTSLHGGGVKHFEVASLSEIQQIKAQFPNAKLYFMHPVKSPEAIRAAYHDYGVRAFSIDCRAELYRIMKETRLANDLELFVRLKLPKNREAGIDFSSKFGAAPQLAATLLQLCRPVSVKLGVAFHVGTQASNPAAYTRAIKITAKVIAKSGVPVEVLDVGGGFPATYPDQKMPPLADYMNAIKKAVVDQELTHMELLSEPGRAMVATGGALAVRVERRKGKMLYLNDGTFGGLYDAGGHVRQELPISHVKMGKSRGRAGQTKFTLVGPTCDSMDRLHHEYELADDVAEGDYLIFGNLGAYSAVMRTDFNGFGEAETIWCQGLPTV